MSPAKLLRLCALQCLIANGAALVAHLHFWRMEAPEGSHEQRDVESRLRRAIERLEGYAAERTALTSATSQPCPTPLPPSPS